MSDMWWSRGVGCGLVVVLAVGLVACRGGEEPTPAPSGSGASPTVEASPSPSLDATADEQELIDEAIAALTEYLALANEVENAGGEGWEEKLKPWWGDNEMAASGESYFATLQEYGWHTEGTVRLVDVLGSELVDVDSVRVGYCLDATDVRVLDGSGTQVQEPHDHAFPAEAQLALRDSIWRVTSIQTEPDRDC